MSSETNEDPEKVGPYRVLQRLGAGGMGEVYQAEDERLGRSVALKRVRADDDSLKHVERFRHEARVLAGLNDPAIVQIYDLIEDDGSIWIVMELACGRPLDQILREGPLTPGRTVVIAEKIARALAVAHDAGIVHRDLKPGNVVVEMREDGDRVKVLDFGLAKNLDPDVDPNISQLGQVVGTPTAMSPEQATGALVDHRSDLFSLGAMMYQMLTGFRAFDGGERNQILSRVVHHHPLSVERLVPSVPSELSALVSSLLEKKPEKRPPGAARVAEQLRLLRAGDEDETREMPAVAPVAALSESASRGGGVRGRRQIAVMTAELMLSSLPESQLDPEALSEIVPSFQSLTREIVEHFDGVLSEMNGHQVVATFGFPVAHEQDTERAIHAALEIRRAVESEELASIDGGLSAFRAAVHTGPAVAMDDSSASSSLILGGTLHVVQDLMSSAVEGQVVVSDAAGALARRSFDLEPAVGGSLSILSTSTGLDVSAVAPVALTSRDRELALIEDRWQLVSEGEGQVVLVTGEAGIGKSSLISTFASRVETSWLRCAASPYHGDTALYPFASLLRSLLSEEPAVEVDQDAVRALIDRLGVPAVDEMSAAFSHGGGKAGGVDETIPDHDHPADRARTLDELAEWLFELAESRPLVLIIEDLHWIDASSLDVIERLIEQGPDVPLLLLLSLRPEFDLPWPLRSHVLQLSLRRLPDSGVVELIDAIDTEGAISRTVRDAIIERTDGIPLFVEEVTRTILQIGSDSLGSGDGGVLLPMTLAGSLSARLDRLGEAGRVAQLAAVQGRSFSRSLLERTSGLGQREIEAGLAALVEADLVRAPRATSRRDEHHFKHQLIRDAAYEGMLAKDRQRIHRRIAEQMQESGRYDPALLAHHQQHAGLIEDAVVSLERAWKRAMASAAFVEAEMQMRKALELLPEEDRYASRRIEILGALGIVIATSKSYSAPEMGQVLRQAQDLAARTGDRYSVAGALSGLWLFHSDRAEYERAAEFADEFDEVVTELRSPHWEWLPGLFRGTIAYHQARFRDAIAHHAPATEYLAAAVARDAEEDAQQSLGSGVMALGQTAWCHWFLGNLDEAAQSRRTCFEQLERVGPGVVLTQHLQSLHHLRQRDEILAVAEDALADARRRGTALYVTIVESIWGWAESLTGIRGGLERVRTAVEAYEQTDSRASLAYLCLVLAEAALAAGDREIASAAVARGLSASEPRHSVWAPEVIALRAELERLDGEPDRARASYHLAAEVARTQESRMLELRVLTKWAAVADETPRIQAPLDQLATVVEHFPASCDDEDVSTARLVLAEHGAGSKGVGQ